MIGGVHGQQGQVARAPREAWQRPARVEPVPGTPYGLVIYGAVRVISGPAVGSLVTGIGALVVAIVVACFGVVAATDSVGAWVAGAFAVLAGFLGFAGVGLGVAGMRRSARRAGRAGRAGAPALGGHPAGHPGVAAAGAPGPGGGEVGGRGVAIAGLVCGATAVAVTVFAVLGAVLLASLA